jgi:hypothetical protein
MVYRLEKVMVAIRYHVINGSAKVMLNGIQVDQIALGAPLKLGIDVR